MSMVTKATWVEGEISIWAIPRDPRHVKPGEEPFTYELKDNRSYHWKTGAVCVFSTEMSVQLPAGINLFLKAVETLDKAVQEENAQHNQRIAELNEQRAQLLLLAAPSVDEVLPADTPDGETIVDILVRRDGMDRSEAEDLLEEAKERVARGEDPDEVLMEMFGLEPDYIFELI